MGLDLCRLPHTYLISELIVLIFSLLPRSVFSKLSKLWGLQMVEQHSNCGLKAVDKRIPAQVTGDQHQTLWEDPDGQRYPGKFCVCHFVDCVLCHRQSRSPPQKNNYLYSVHMNFLQLFHVQYCWQSPFFALEHVFWGFIMILECLIKNCCHADITLHSMFGATEGRVLDQFFFCCLNAMDEQHSSVVFCCSCFFPSSEILPVLISVC